MKLLLATLLALGSAQTPPQLLAQPSSVERPVSVERSLSVERSRDLLAASVVLHDWDARREAAWAASDAAALRSLYVPGASAARSDVRLLREYADHGLVVRHIVTQVFALRVLRSDPGRLRLRVVDRVAGGLIEQGESRRVLGTTRPTRRVISFRGTGGTWRVVSVRGRDPRR